MRGKQRRDDPRRREAIRAARSTPVPCLGCGDEFIPDANPHALLCRPCRREDR